MEKNSIVTCEICQKTSETVKFQKYRKICNSCNSKQFNSKKEYFQEYYAQKTADKPKKPRGRPRTAQIYSLNIEV